MPPRVSTPAIAALMLTAALLLRAIPAMATEEAPYTVVKQYPGFELRRYPPLLVAENRVSGDFDGVGNRAFRTLADFIFGKNRTGESIAMTAPVNQRPVVPAATGPDASPQPSPAQGDYVVTFVMPKGFTASTLPAPTDPHIEIRTEPARLMAARRYAGRWTLGNYRAEESALLVAVRDAGLVATAPPVYARYNAPFVPWFMRRNEVLVEVRDAAAPPGTEP
jgi:hypothetical protein